ncbi:periplasmic heavy metal sensor [Luteolibacter sp. Populi]|uniref:periplasmic heavy metal sensor n=1 Tax=Luteolibacter sp. Populi TaxID=3230487 RepID=UPI003467DB50
MSAGSGRFLWAAGTIVLSAAAAVFVSHGMRGAGKKGASEEDFHRWMHEQLAITPAQHKALDPIELAFEKERANLRAEITAAGRELADAVRKGKAGSPEIESALARLNAAQAKLQRTTLEHFFAMKEHLDPAQAEKLLQWTHDSILAH